MSVRFVLSAIGLTLAGLAMSGCVDDRRFVADRPGPIVLDRAGYVRGADRYDHYRGPERRGYRRYDYRDYARARRQAERNEFCEQYPGNRRCFGRQW